MSGPTGESAPEGGVPEGAPSADAMPADATEVPAAAPAAPAPAASDGRTLGIVALVLAFVFQLLGLILGFVALDQSRRAGRGNAPARAAIIVSIVLIVLWVGAIATALVAAGSIQDDCDVLGTGIHEVDGITVTCPG